MDSSIRRGSWEMVAAMLISGSIGWFVLVSGVSVIEVVFWRCVIGALTLLLVCAWLGYLRGGSSELLHRVAAHNHQDVVTLALLLQQLVSDTRQDSDPAPRPLQPR